MSIMFNPISLIIFCNLYHRECFDGIAKPVNLSGVQEKEVMVPQGLSTVVCDIKPHWTNKNHTTVVTALLVVPLCFFGSKSNPLNIFFLNLDAAWFCSQ